MMAIIKLDKYGARSNNRSKKPVFLAIKPVPKAAILPIKTRVKANPREKAPTNTNPKLIFPRFKQIKKTVIAAGQGISPPEKPNNIVCEIPTRPEDRRSFISLAWVCA